MQIYLHKIGQLVQNTIFWVIVLRFSSVKSTRAILNSALIAQQGRERLATLYPAGAAQ